MSYGYMTYKVEARAEKVIVYCIIEHYYSISFADVFVALFLALT